MMQKMMQMMMVYADVDECPYDADNDIDGDSVCGDIDECPLDTNDDSDGCTLL